MIWELKREKGSTFFNYFIKKQYFKRKDRMIISD